MSDRPGQQSEQFGQRSTLTSSEGRRISGDSSEATLAPGTRLEGVYEVRRLLGKGAMGAVYLVEHIGLGKQFAAKVVGGSRAMDPGAIARLRTEARIASSIEHENIVNVTHLGKTEDGTVFIIMELLRGEDLRTRMERQLDEARQGRGTAWLPDSEVREIVPAVLSGLAAAHHAGVVHRDLKPDNVFLAQTRQRTRPKIVDFGIGKLRESEQKELRLTETGQIVGTPLYMAPEQSRAVKDTDHRADLYALGVMTFEMVCGQPPFEASNLYEIVIKHATEAPPDPRSIRPDLPEAVARVILRALEKKPSDRFESADAMLGAWEQAWSPGARPTSIRPAPREQPAAASVAAEGGAPAGPRSSTRLAFGAGLAVLGLAGGLLLAPAMNSASRSPPASPAQVVEEDARESPDAASARQDAGSPSEGALRGSRQVHVIRSSPTGAEILRDGQSLGTTPYSLTLAPDEHADLVVRLRGHRDATLSITDTDGDVEVTLRRVRGAPTGGDFPGLAPPP